MERLKKKMISRIVYLIWALGIVLLAYLPGKTDFWLLLLNYSVVFACYWLIIDPTNKIRLKSLLLIAVITRLALIPATPSLSDEMYRYVWDGQVSLSLENPYAKTPTEWMQSDHKPYFLDTTLYVHLNSPDHYTVYPPLTQLVFGTGVLAARGDTAGSAFWTKAIIVVIEMSLLFVIVPLLRRLGKDPGMVAIYAFNPLVLIEISGNMRLEGLAVVFLASALMYYQGNRGIRSGLMMGLSAGIKLVPMIMIPILATAKNFKQKITFVLAALFSLLIVFFPLLFKGAWRNYLEALGSHISSSEFNSPIFFLIKSIIEWNTGNQSPAMSGILSLSIFGVIYLSFIGLVVKKRLEKKKMIEALIVITSLFFLFQTAVHPWYIIPLVLLSSLTGWRYPLIWSGLIFLSYHAYTTEPFVENLWLTILIYSGVLISAWHFDRKKISELFTNHTESEEYSPKEFE
ncbi:MAG: DUF2029 domain-containing protein [Saprospirales bacterium]|nr:MAG: DUF2029 domain-containing protein [Saprospirales bacterium]